MTSSTKDKVIVHKSYGEIDIYKCSIENAMKIFDNYCEEFLSEHVKELSKKISTGEEWVSTFSMVNALSDISLGKDSYYLAQVIGKEEPYPVTKEMTDIMDLFLMRRNSGKKIKNSQLFTLHPEKELPWFKEALEKTGFDAFKYYDPEHLETSRIYWKIKERRFNTETPEVLIVGRILRFLTEVGYVETSSLYVEKVIDPTLR